MHLLGKISKTHGYNGTIILVSDHASPDDELENLQEIFVMIDGLSVPFPVEEMEIQTDTSAYLKLEFIDNQNEALQLIGCEVYAEITPKERNIETGLNQWVGFSVNDVVYGNIGVIRQIEDYKGNIVLQIVNGNKETLISLFPELVTNIDHTAKTLHIHAPDGYF